MTKVCAKCGIEKGAEAFCRAAAASTGLQSWCKACMNARKKEKRAEAKKARGNTRRRRTSPHPSLAPGRGGVVYGLFDPTNGELRYIGKTVDPLQKRLENHLYTATRWKKNGKLCDRTWRAAWIRHLAEVGAKPEIEMLEAWPDHAQLVQAEIWNIAYYRSVGCRLTNITDGGEGNLGRIRTAEERRRISDSNIRAKSKVSDTQIDEMCRRYLAGEKMRDLAVAFGLARHTVSKWLTRRGHVARTQVQNSRKKIPASLLPQLVEEYKAGATLTALAAKYGTYSSNIYHNLRRLGIRTRSHVEAARSQARSFQDHLGNTYASQSEAAKKLNISQSAVSLVLRGKMSRASGYSFTYRNM